MWTFIKPENLEAYLNEYPQLAENFQEISLYETPDKIFLPRLFWKNFPSKHVQIFDNPNNQFEPIPTFFRFTGKLREKQIPIVNTILDIYQKKKSVNGIVKAFPGIGKTVLSTYVAAKMGIKTCIIVDNTSLMDQWIQAFYEFTDLKENEIGIIRQKLFAVDRPICIAMVQTLLSKIKTDMHKNFKVMDDAKFGLVIYDEIHNTSSAPKFAKASLLFRTKNIIGLSATPFQTGTAEILMNNTVGEIIYETKEYDLKPTYNLHYYDSKLAPKYSGMLARMGDYIRRKAYYNSIVIKSPEYLTLIMDLIKQRIAEGHTILILCFTKVQIKLISDELEKINIDHRRYYGDEKESIDKDNVKVMIGTYSFCGKGFDFAQLSNLILASNLAGKKSLIQVIGRILRSCNEKLPPMVDDLIDIGFPSIFLPDVKTKKSVVTGEFDCQIRDIKHYEE